MFMGSSTYKIKFAFLLLICLTVSLVTRRAKEPKGEEGESFSPSLKSLIRSHLWKREQRSASETARRPKAFKAMGGRACIKWKGKGQVEREEENEGRAVFQKPEEKIISRRKLANTLKPPKSRRVGAGKPAMEEYGFGAALRSDVREKPRKRGEISSSMSYRLK